MELISPENKIPVCGTYPICERNVSIDISLISTPSKVIFPLVTSKNLGINFARVDLPLPVLPIIATVCPGFASKSISSKTFSSPSAYLKSTWSNLTTALFVFSVNALWLSFMVISVFNTSSILLAATAALGSIIETIVSIKNPMIIIIEYVINAVIVPTSITPWSIFFAATQIIRTETPFITNISAGIINDMALFVKSITLVRLPLASSNLSSSFFSLLKALITERPVKISLEIRLTLSTNFCIILNLGIATTISTPMIHTTTATARTIVHSIPEL